jgi:hypothetical protein
MSANAVSVSGTIKPLLEGKVVHEETERLIERANLAIAQSLVLLEENRSSVSQARAWLRFLHYQAERMKPKDRPIATLAGFIAIDPNQAVAGPAVKQPDRTATAAFVRIGQLQR